LKQAKLIILQIIGIAIGLIVLELAIVGFAPGFAAPKQPLKGARQEDGKANGQSNAKRKDVTFQVDGTSLSAWLYLPDDLSTPVPCIVMGHGFGGTKSMLLDAYAIRYREAGFAVLAFDYRHFGESAGEPRQLFSIARQLEDFAAAIDYARKLEEVSFEKIALWGTSASGGHVVLAAAKDEKIACVVAQCPAIDPKASEKALKRSLGLGHIVRLFFHGQRDMIRSRFGLSPHKIPIVGKPGTIAVFAHSDAYDGYAKAASLGFVNEVCARFILRSHGYRPDKEMKNLHCPILIQICDRDRLVPISPEVEKESMKYAEIKHYPIGHFDIYLGDNFEKSVSDQLAFLKDHL
jgi:pimeloyl-ACP methyl ester carboxylesterase